jgi:hypothetical protein
MGLVVLAWDLECAPLEVSSPIPHGVNFGGLVHTEQNKLGFKWGPLQVGRGIGLLGLIST